MALGLSGSNGGITKSRVRLSSDYLDLYKPLEVSYFVNNICNLKCRHCYVGYKDHSRYLNYNDWVNTFNELIILGAKTFGNVGKEPLMSWDETNMLLRYFEKKRDFDKKIRFGIVTNGLLMSNERILEIDRIQPDYVDISIDGGEHEHDKIRGKGTYNKLIAVLKELSTFKIANNVFLSFTLNRLNMASLSRVIETIYNLGFRNILVSPYVTFSINDDLFLTENEIYSCINRILEEKIINFSNYNGLNIYFKSDYSTSGKVMNVLKEKGVINENHLFIDEYGVVFNEYKIHSNSLYFNYLPYDNTFMQSIRISHDGFVSGCKEMFYENYTSRAIGNIKKQSIIELLEMANQSIAR